MKDKHYNLGNGEVAIAFGETIKPGKNNVIPFIRICDLEEKRNLGENITEKEAGRLNITYINVDTIRGLDLLQEGLDHCREILLKKNKL